MIRRVTTTAQTQAMDTQPDVAGAAKDAWRVLGESAEVVDWDILALNLGLFRGDAIKKAVLVPRVTQIECVLDPAKSMRDARHDLVALLAEGWVAAEGWRVSALVPISKLGAAHEALRGLDLRLQGWWTNAENGLRFSSAETP
jgi:hypothetical protein